MTWTVARLGARGDGVIGEDMIGEGPLYAPFTLPGEVIDGAPDGERIPAPRILTPSPARVTAPCRHFRQCGGCSVQHASDDFVAAWKRDQVAQALRARGFQDVEVLATRTSPPATRRRAVFAARRRKSGETLGFHRRADHMVVDIAECAVLDPALTAILPALRPIIRLAASRKGELRMTATASLGGVDLALEDAKPLDGPMRMEAALAADRADLARLVWNGDEVVTRRAPLQTFGAARIAPPPGAFLQATAAGEAALWEVVQRGIAGAAKVADLFAGCGAFTLPAAETAEVHAVEGDAAMLGALDRGWRETAGALKRVTTEARDLFRRPLQPAELNAHDAIVLDPPRAGAEAQARMIADSDVGVVVSLSCDPGTFARDLRILADAGFTPGPVQPIDQFRWSHHVEVGCVLRRG